MGEDDILRFEEDNFQELAEKFAEKNRDKAVISFEDFVWEEFEKEAAAKEWEDDR